MTKYNDNFQEIFKSLKDGDCLGFYRGGVFGFLIPLATRGKCNHIGIALNVQRNGDVLSFNFSQQTFRGGSFDEVRIYRVGDKIITDEPYFVKQDAIYYRSLREPLLEKQRQIAIDDAISQIGKKYGYFELLLGFEFLERVLPSFIKDFIYKNSRKLKGVCTTHCVLLYRKVGLLSTQDFFITPIEFLRLKFFKQDESISNNPSH